MLPLAGEKRSKGKSNPLAKTAVKARRVNLRGKLDDLRLKKKHEKNKWEYRAMSLKRKGKILAGTQYPISSHYKKSGDL